MTEYAREMTQRAPYPYELDELVETAHAFPGWHFNLVNEMRSDDGCSGLTLEIIVHGEDSLPSRRGERKGTRHLFVVPAATYNRKSWQAWIRERCVDVMNHEIGEWLRFGEDPDPERPFAPNHGAGHDPYFTYVASTAQETATAPGR